MAAQSSQTSLATRVILPTPTGKEGRTRTVDAHPDESRSPQQIHPHPGTNLENRKLQSRHEVSREVQKRWTGSAHS